MKTLGLFLPKERSEVLAPTPATHEEFSSLSSETKDGNQGDTIVNAEEESVKGLLSNTSAEPGRKLSLDSVISGSFKTGGECIHGFTNVSEAAKDRILPTAKLKATPLHDPSPPSLYSFSPSISSTLFGSAKLNNSDNKPPKPNMHFSMRSNKSCKRPSLEYLVARLHNRVEESKAKAGRISNDTLSNSSILPDNKYIIDEKINERKQIASCSNFARNESITRISPQKETLYLQDCVPWNKPVNNESLPNQLDSENRSQNCTTAKICVPFASQVSTDDLKTRDISKPLIKRFVDKGPVLFTDASIHINKGDAFNSSLAEKLSCQEVQEATAKIKDCIIVSNQSCQECKISQFGDSASLIENINLAKSDSDMQLKKDLNVNFIEKQQSHETHLFKVGNPKTIDIISKNSNYLQKMGTENDLDATTSLPRLLKYKQLDVAYDQFSYEESLTKNIKTDVFSSDKIQQPNKEGDSLSEGNICKTDIFCQEINSTSSALSDDMPSGPYEELKFGILDSVAMPFGNTKGEHLVNDIENNASINSSSIDFVKGDAKLCPPFQNLPDPTCDIVFNPSSKEFGMVNNTIFSGLSIEPLDLKTSPCIHSTATTHPILASPYSINEENKPEKSMLLDALPECESAINSTKVQPKNLTFECDAIVSSKDTLQNAIYDSCRKDSSVAVECDFVLQRERDLETTAESFCGNISDNGNISHCFELVERKVDPSIIIVENKTPDSREYVFRINTGLLSGKMSTNAYLSYITSNRNKGHSLNLKKKKFKKSYVDFSTIFNLKGSVKSGLCSNISFSNESGVTYPQHWSIDSCVLQPFMKGSYKLPIAESIIKCGTISLNDHIISLHFKGILENNVPRIFTNMNKMFKDLFIANIIDKAVSTENDVNMSDACLEGASCLNTCQNIYNSVVAVGNRELSSFSEKYQTIDKGKLDNQDKIDICLYNINQIFETLKTKESKRQYFSNSFENLTHFQSVNLFKKFLMDNYDNASKVDHSCYFDIKIQELMDKILNNQHDSYCSSPKLENLKFSVSINPSISFKNYNESNSNTIFSLNFNHLGLNGEPPQSCIKSFDDCLKFMGEGKAIVEPVCEEDCAQKSFVENSEDQSNSIPQSNYSIDEKSFPAWESMNFPESQLEEVENVMESQFIELEFEQYYKAYREELYPNTDKHEFTTQEISLSEANLMQLDLCSEISPNMSFLDFLKIDQPLTSGVCVLCQYFYEDLCWHGSQFHTCISYIPVYQTNAFIHHMRERIGFVTHSYSDSLYGNPLYICKCCNLLFKTINSVRVHLNFHKEIYMIQSSSQVCICHKSNFKYPYQKWQALLFRSKFFCSFCNYVFACQNGLLNHLKIVHFNLKYCQVCNHIMDSPSNAELMEHNNYHYAGNEENLVVYKETIEPELDQTHFSWNALDNHLNYLDGKVFRLNALKDLNKRLDRKNLIFPMRVDPLYAVVPENVALSPAPEMPSYVHLKLDSKLMSKLDEYATNVFDLPVQMMLQKKFAITRKRKAKSLLRQAQEFLPTYLELYSPFAEPKNVSQNYPNGTSDPPTRCIYSRKAKMKIAQKPSLKQKVSEENVLKPSRTRSGTIAKDVGDDVSSFDSSRISNVTIEITGEWRNYHTYVCCACGAVFLDLAEMMDHKWEAHPGVWCAHTMIQGQEKVPKMFYQQYSPAHSRNSYLNSSSRGSYHSKENAVKGGFVCSQCRTKFVDKELLHLHIIDCGGLNQIIPNRKKNKKGIRFKRRKGQGIPSRRYAIHSAAPTPQKNSFDKESRISTPTKEDVPCLTSANSAKVVKRRLELAIGSIENSKLKNKLRAILSKQKKPLSESPRSSKACNLKRRLRKKKFPPKPLRFTRHSGLRKETNDGKTVKKDGVSLSKRENRDKAHPSDNSKDKKDSVLRRKIVSSSNKIDSNQRANLTPTANKIEEVSTCVEKIKKLVSFGNKEKILDEGNLPPLKANVTTLANQELNISRTSKHMTKWKKVPKSETTSKLQKTFQKSVLAKNSVNELHQVLDCELSVLNNDIVPPKQKECSLPPLQPDNLEAKGGKDESDSSSEPEVICNFRRTRLTGRVGLRTRKSQTMRYSLRPPVITAKDNGDDSNLDKNLHDDDEDDIFTPHKSKRIYNIGDDDEDSIEEKALISSDSEENTPLSDMKKIISKLALKKSNPESFSNELEKSQDDDSHQAFASFKNVRPKLRQFSSLSRKKFNNLKRKVQNADNPTGFSFCFKEMKKSKLTAISSPPSEGPGEMSTRIVPISLNLRRRDATNTESAIVHNNKRKLEHRHSKPKKRKTVLTPPEIIISDTESDVPQEFSLSKKKEKVKNSSEDVAQENNESAEKEAAVDGVFTQVGSVARQQIKRKRGFDRNCKSKKTKSTAILETKSIKSSTTILHCVSSSKDIQSLNPSSLKRKLKAKRKYTLNKKNLDVPVHETSPHKSRNKKILKEVSVLSYKSLNTREFPSLLQMKDENGKEVLQEKEKIKKKKTQKGMNNIDENSPFIAKNPPKYKKHSFSSKLPKRCINTPTDSRGFLCIDCGLSFDSALSREDHRQDCRNIAFEMSLMAEDHLYECPYCQLTFALRGTQRKHITSCRMSRSRRCANRKKKQSNGNNTTKVRLKGSQIAIAPAQNSLQTHSKVPSPEPSSPLIQYEDESVMCTINSVKKGLEEPQINLFGNRLVSYCEEFVGVKEICALMNEFEVCTNELRSLLTLSTNSENSTTIIQFDSRSSASSSYQNSNYGTLQRILKQNAVLFSQSFLNSGKEKTQTNGSTSLDGNTVIKLNISRTELLKALSSVEELLKEVATLESFQKKEQMLLAMKENFQSGTGS